MDWLLRYADPSLDWTYASVTLIVRFIGVFIVMAVMQVALQIAARLIRRIEAPKLMTVAAELAGKGMPVSSLDLSGVAEDHPAVDWAVVAAVGLALDMESRTRAGKPPATAGTSSWTVAGRMRQLNRLPR